MEHLALVLALAAGPKIVDCKTFHTWLDAQPVAALTLVSPPLVDPRTYPAPRAPDKLAISFRGATYHRGYVGGGGCLGGWYDPATGRAAIVELYDTAQDTLFFEAISVPRNITERALSSVTTARGVALGMTVRQVERIEGRGSLTAGARGAMILRYYWPLEKKYPTGVSSTLSFLFRNGRLIAIDYLYGA